MVTRMYSFTQGECMKLQKSSLQNKMSLNPRFERIYCLTLRPIMTVPSKSQE